MAPPDPEPARVAAADVAGVAVADSTTETETCETIEVEVDDDGKTKTVYLCRRDSEDAGESVGADVVAGDGGDGTICWYWVVEYRIAGILVGRTVTFLFCEDDSGGCGGGGPGGGGPQADCVAASLTLKCPTAERGSTATCTATVAEDDEVDASELVFDWSSGFDAAWTDTTGTDESEWSSKWSGVATDSTEITVTVTGGGISEMSESVTIAVTARPWALYETISWDSPNYFHDLDPDIWGAHDVTPDEEPAELSGNGPWDGTVIIASRPNIYSNLWLHTDFLSDGASYGKVDSIPTHAHPCVRGLGSSATVYELNEACGLSGALSSFHGKVDAHERKHLASFNSCLDSETAKANQRDLEALVGVGLGGSRTLSNRWATFVNMIDDANEGQVSGDQSSDIWHRGNRTDSGRWLRGSVTTASHGGTRGC